MDAQSLKHVADKNLYSIIIFMPPVVYYTAEAFQSLLKSFFPLNTTKILPCFFLYMPLKMFKMLNNEIVTCVFSF